MESLALPDYVLGVDPGETVGVCRLNCVGGLLTNVDIVQCNLSAAPAVIAGLITGIPTERLTMAVESFVVGSRAARSTKARAGERTRLLIGWLKGEADSAGFKIVQRPASAVKPWASNERLKAAGITGVGGHSLDAARHALFEAVAAGYCPDPLRKTHRSRSE